MIVKKITALGTRKNVEGIIFTAKRNKAGQYILNRKVSSPISGNTTNHAVNKVYVETLDDALELLRTNDYLINLTSDDGVRALRQFSKVVIEYDAKKL